MATPAMTTKPRATAPHARMDPHTARRGMFVLEDGRNVVFTFFLLVFLFALWGFCNGMIDVMDKHFQEELGSIWRPRQAASVAFSEWVINR